MLIIFIYHLIILFLLIVTLILIPIGIALAILFAIAYIFYLLVRYMIYIYDFNKKKHEFLNRDYYLCTFGMERKDIAKGFANNDKTIIRLVSNLYKQIKNDKKEIMINYYNDFKKNFLIQSFILTGSVAVYWALHNTIKQSNNASETYLIIGLASIGFLHSLYWLKNNLVYAKLILEYIKNENNLEIFIVGNYQKILYLKNKLFIFNFYDILIPLWCSMLWIGSLFYLFNDISFLAFFVAVIIFFMAISHFILWPTLVYDIILHREHHKLEKDIINNEKI